MPTDCEKLSPNAFAIFKKLEAHFPPDSWKNARWFKDGRIQGNGQFDLKTSADRSRLIETEKSFLGYAIGLEAKGYREKTGSLEGFANERYSKLLQQHVELLLILEDLDYQIETMDMVEV